MKSFQSRIEINYTWSSMDHSKLIDQATQEELEEEAKKQILHMIKEGYREGELLHCVNNHEYKGWWASNQITQASN